MEGSCTEKDTHLTSQPDSSLTFDKPNFKLPSHPSKATLRRTMHDFNTRVTQHYSIVKDLAQAPCAMFVVEVLQSCRTQLKALLSTIDGVDPSDTSIISFDSNHCEPCLPPLVTFMLTICYLRKNIYRTVLDEGVATCIMSLSCWKALDSPNLISSPILLKAFYAHVFKPHGILTSLPLEIKGKTISIEEEVIDAALDYNLLSGRTWFYAMKEVALTVFRLLRFPHQGKIVTIDYLNYCMPGLHPNVNTIVPLISESTSISQSIGAGMFKDPCLMGVFPLFAPDIPKVAPINTISSIGSYDPWVISLPSEIESLGDTILLFPTELSYSAIQSVGEFVDTVSGTFST